MGPPGPAFSADPIRGTGMPAITDKEFAQFSEFIKKNYGIYLKPEKKALLTGRLHQIMLGKNFSSFTEYYDYLVNDKSGEAITAFLNRITTNHTFFMREADHFFYFRDHVLPELEKKVKDRDLRIWSAACSSGEEPYTLAMVIDEYFGNRKSSWDTQLLATDISMKVLEIARKGVYSNERIAPLPAEWRRKYFEPVDEERSMVTEKIKKEVLFRRFNLMEACFPFSKKFHVIFCRNVMIYFQEDTKSELIRKFYNHMEDGGYLFVGHSETITRGETGFKSIMPAVYRKES